MNDIKNPEVISPETLKSQYVSPQTCIFSTGANGFLSAEINGTRHKRVILTRALPLSLPDEYICISDTEKNELGIIERAADFSAEQQELIRRELGQRYFCPVITEIKEIKEKMGQFYFDVSIGAFKKSFAVKDISKSIRQRGESIDLTDIDGNRYTVERFNDIPSKSRRKLEPYLY